MPLECALYYSNGIKGSNEKGGREDSSLVVELNHKVSIPHDEQRGKYSGLRTHGAVMLIKELDLASPLLYDACCRGQTLDELYIQWYRITPAGQEEVYFTTRLKNVKVVSVESVLPNTKDRREEKKMHLEKLELLYQHITWEHVDGTIADDSYQAA